MPLKIRLIPWFLTVSFLSSLLLSSACTEEQENVPRPPGQELRSSKQRITVPNVQDTDVDLQVAGNTAFALDLYTQLRANNQDNLFFSPHSIEVALAMTWAGARTGTEAAMAGTLHFELDQAHLHPFFNYLDLEFSSSPGSGDDPGEGRFELNIINKIWGRLGTEFLDGFLDVLAENYGTGLYLLDFEHDPKGSAEKINAWVEQITNRRILDLLPPGSISKATVLVLVNAIYFNAAWQYPFKEERTRDGTFHTADGRDVQVSMMNQTEEFPCEEGDGYQAVELPYHGEDFSMLILAPDLGTLDTFERQLTASFLELVRSSLYHGNLVELTMPSWQLEGKTFSLKEMLTNLGMEIAFDPQSADLSGMNSDGPLWIDDVLHQAFVKVDESGTEAAASTAVIVEGDSSMPPMGPEIILDRPFIYLILDRATGQILFVGRVVDPS